MNHLVIREIASMLHHLHNRTYLVTGLDEEQEFKLRHINVRLKNIATEFDNFSHDLIPNSNYAKEIIEGAHRMEVDLKSTLDISDETFDNLKRAAQLGI